MRESAWSARTTFLAVLACAAVVFAAIAVVEIFGHRTFLAAAAAACSLVVVLVIGLLSYLYGNSLRRAALQQAQLAAIVSYSNDAVVGIDLEGRVTQWNQAAERLFRYTAGEAIGRSAVELIVPMDRADEESGILRRVSAGEVVPHFESLRRRRDGTVFPVSVTVSPVRSERGRIAGAAKIIRDISEQKAAAERLLELNSTLERQVEERTRHIDVLRDRLRIATRAVKMGVWDWNVQTQELIWDEQMYALYGIDPAAGSGTYEMWRERLHGADLERTESLLMSAVAGAAEYDTEFRILRPGGEERYISAKAIVIRDGNDRPERVVGVNLDSTEAHHARRALLDAKDAAEKANLAKSQFLANMSHEIRTPMNAILGMLQLLGRTDLARHQSDYVEKAESSARTLLGILNDVLDFSKVEAERLVLDPRPFVPDVMLGDVGVILAASVGNKPVEVVFDIGPELRKRVVGDDLRLKQVLINLGGNAVKFTERGEVVLSLRLVEERDDELLIEFRVRDTGIGISPGEQARIFEGFSQAEASTTRRYGGTGLGLAISQRLVRLMGGELRLESEPGGGSDFHFVLPLRRDTTSPVPVPADIGLHGLRTLIADDNATARRLLAEIAASFGWPVTAVGSIDEALRAVEERRSMAEAFDVVLLDWRMPGIDSWAACRHIRELRPDRPSTVIVMTTALGREELSQRMSKGESPPHDGFIVKPITPSMLFDAVADARAGDGQLWNARHVLSSGPRRLAGRRLLVVEDNPINQQVARELLRSEGADVAVAASGREGVDAVVHAADPFHLVLMDIQMPDIDGITATAMIRRHPEHRGLPIVAMTANAMTEDREACLAAGMDDHVGKPFHIDDLVSLILAHTRSTPAIPSPATPAVTPVVEGMAIERALARFGNDRALFARLAREFARTHGQGTLEVRSMLSRQDLPAAASWAHSLKGAAATLGALGLARAAGIAGEALRSGLDETGPGPLLDDLDREFALAIAALERFAEDGPEAARPIETGDPLLARLDRLGRLLQDRNLEALESMASLRRSLTDVAPDLLPALGDAVDALDFDAALGTLGLLRRKVSPP